MAQFGASLRILRALVMKMLTVFRIECSIEGDVMIASLCGSTRLKWTRRRVSFTGNDDFDFKIRRLDPIQGLFEFSIGALIGQIAGMDQHIASW